MEHKKNIITALFVMAAFGANNALADDNNADNGKEKSWQVNTMFRTILETGEKASNFYYPEIIMTAKKDNWEIMLAPDLVDRTPEFPGGDMYIRTAIATAAYTTGNLNFKAGMLPPFGRRSTGKEFDSGMPGAYLSDALKIQGGVIGAQTNYTHSISDNTKLTAHIMAGTKLPWVSKYGNPKDAGFNAIISGAGIDITHQINSNTTMEAGYNYTYAGKGSNGTQIDTHYAHANITTKIANLTIQALGEAQYDNPKNFSGQFVKNQTSYVAMLQAKGDLTHSFGYRIAGGVANHKPAVEAFLTYKPKNWAIQIGGAAVHEKGGTDLIGNITIIRRF